MGYDNDRLNDIFDKTDRDCHICGKRLAFSNYGVIGARGAWEVEHSVPRSRGGTDRLSNLYAACICWSTVGTAGIGTGCTRACRRRRPLNEGVPPA